MDTPKRASFSIEKYYFNQVHINLDNQSEDGLFIDFRPSGVYSEKDKTYNLSIIFSAYSSKEDTKPFVEVKCVAIFKFSEIETFEEIPDFFYRNSIAILFPYIRAYISMVTNQANITQINLPTLNLTSLEKPLRDNTTIVE